MRIIDADEFKHNVVCVVARASDSRGAYIISNIDDAPTIPTKQVKYYDEDEKVWKIGSVIVDE